MKWLLLQIVLTALVLVVFAMLVLLVCVQVHIRREHAIWRAFLEFCDRVVRRLGRDNRPRLTRPASLLAACSQCLAMLVRAVVMSCGNWKSR